jgi:hypothetical protein
LSGGGGPPAPDYVGAAEATAAGNLQSLQYQTQANRVNQVGPNGSTSWTATPNASAYQSALAAWQAGGRKGMAPTQNEYQNWTQTTELNPQEQAALTAQQNTQAGLSQLGQGMEANVASTMSQPFNAPQLSSYMSGVPSVNDGYSGFNASGVPGVNTSFNGNTPVNLNSQSMTGGAGSVNLNAPQFSNALAQQGANAAFGSEMSLVAPQMQEQYQNTSDQLKAQGLTPGTVAYDNAMRDLSDSQSAQYNQAANQAVLTGNQMANQNYASALSGYQAGNQAQNQAFGQGMSTFDANNSAANQAYSQALGTFGANNTAQNQAYTQALQNYGTGQTAIANQNAAQNQQFGQAQAGYSQAYQAALQNYMQPLNAMNAVTSSAGGVTNPQFPSYFQQGYAGGPNYSQAANNQGAFNANQYAAQQQTQANEIGAGVGLAGTAAMAFAL